MDNSDVEMGIYQAGTQAARIYVLLGSGSNNDCLGFID